MVTHGWVEGMVHASDARMLGQISASGEGVKANLEKGYILIFLNASLMKEDKII